MSCLLGCCCWAQLQTKYQEFRERGEWRLSHKATIAALLISLYKVRAHLALPNRVLPVAC